MSELTKVASESIVSRSIFDPPVPRNSQERQTLNKGRTLGAAIGGVAGYGYPSYTSGSLAPNKRKKELGALGGGLGYGVGQMGASYLINKRRRDRGELEPTAAEEDMLNHRDAPKELL